MSSTSFRSQFENLSNEILYEIFDYLNHYHVYQAFNPLNSRFNNLLYHSNTPLHVNMSFLSKSKFQRYLTQMVLPNSDRIRSLHFANRPMFDEMFSCSENRSKFNELRTIILDNLLTFEHLDSFASFCNLSSLIIHRCDFIETTYELCHDIFSLPNLKYCKISMTGFIKFQSLINSFNSQRSRLEHLSITSKCDLRQLPYLLSCLPQLRRLSIDYLSDYQSWKPSIVLPASNQLTHISLKLKAVRFNRLEQFLAQFPVSLEVFRISVDDDLEYFNANRWERLITNFMPNLRLFDIENIYVARGTVDPLMDENSIKQFTTPFWLDRKWFIGYQQTKMDRYLIRRIFYSGQPYR